MRLADFLIIGAQKSGTTSLYRDLEANPEVYFPMDKEPHDLASDAVLTEAGRAAYAAHFAGARADQRCGEASTGYTKRPTFEGVAERALRVLGPAARLVYVVRNPITRAISHHHFKVPGGQIPVDVNRAVREDETLLAYGRYAYQLEPWLEAFGRERLMVVPFERYITERAAVVDEISAFLGVAPRGDLVHAEKVYNKGDERVLVRGIWRLNQHPVYRRVIRPLMPRALKDRLKRRMLPKTTPRPEPPTRETVDWMIEQVAEDADRLASIMGTSGPVWDFEAERLKYAPASENARPGPGAVAEPAGSGCGRAAGEPR